MERITNILKEVGVLDFCAICQLDFEKTFFGKSNGAEGWESSYAYWSVNHNPTPDLVGGLVVYAVPQDVMSQCWEAWYIIGETFYHRVLSKKPGAQCHGEVDVSSDDPYHPVETKGFHWYYYDDPSSIPLKFRQANH